MATTKMPTPATVASAMQGKPETLSGAEAIVRTLEDLGTEIVLVSQAAQFCHSTMR